MYGLLCCLGHSFIVTSIKTVSDILESQIIKHLCSSEIFTGCFLFLNILNSPIRFDPC